MEGNCVVTCTHSPCFYTTKNTFNLLNLRESLVDSLAKLSLAKASVFVSSVTIALNQVQFFIHLLVHSLNPGDKYVKNVIAITRSVICDLYNYVPCVGFFRERA